ncbi:lysophospholipid acyltransferase family protein [Candidatus Poribacteria bacterium]|nr:lysophospholipid acyltransferase family protein [Candidatus Poribacteria bacterium]
MEKQTKSRRVHPLVRAILWMLPPVYKAYMGLVFLTSKRTFYNFGAMKKLRDEGASILGAIWHQNVVLVPFTFRSYNVVTMVSHSDQGAVMAPIAKRLGFIPIRGGSSMGGSEALATVIDYVRTHDRIFCGLTVDGSRGPNRKVKKGIIVIAKESGAPIYPVMAWAKRKILLPTWDHTLVPLPFNEFVYFCGTPVTVSREAALEGIEAKRKELEDNLLKLAERAENHFTSDRPKEYPNDSKAVHYGTRTV